MTGGTGSCCAGLGSTGTGCVGGCRVGCTIGTVGITTGTGAITGGATIGTTCARALAVATSDPTITVNTARRVAPDMAMFSTLRKSRSALGAGVLAAGAW